MSTASDDLDLALAARRKILKGQSARWGNRQWTGVDLGELGRLINTLKREVAAENRAASGTETGPAVARFC